MAGLSKSKTVLYKGFYRTEHAVAELKKKEQGLITEAEIRQKELEKKREVKEEEKEIRREAGGVTDVERLMKEGDIAIAKKREPIQLQSPEERARIEAINLAQERPTQQEAVGIALEQFKKEREEPWKLWDPEAKIDVEAAITAFVLGPGGAVVDMVGQYAVTGLSKITSKIAEGIGNRLFVNRVIGRLAEGKAGAISGTITPGATKGLLTSEAVKGSVYAVTEKSIALTTKSLLKRGITGATVAFIVGAFGTYPFSAWGRQEVLSGLKILSRDLRERGDFEGAEELFAMREELQQITWHDFVPYVLAQIAL